MTQHWHVHPTHPQPRLMKQAAERLAQGDLIVLPTDASYVLACLVGEKDPLDRLRRLRQLDDRHHLTLMCRDLSEIATYARVDNHVFRLLKAHTPGAFTFILNATREVPKRLQHPKRQTLGLRVPDHPVPLALMAQLGEPLLTCSLILPGDEEPLVDPEEIALRLAKQVDLVLDAGFGTTRSTTVVDLSGDDAVILRQGEGDGRAFL